MSLFNGIESYVAPDVYELDLVEVEKYLCKGKYAGRQEKLIRDSPHSKIPHTIGGSEQICERYRGAIVKVGEEFVHTEVQFIPARLKVIGHYRETYECRTCHRNGTPYMEESLVPCPRSCIPLRLLPQPHSPSIRSLSWAFHYIAKKRSGRPRAFL